MKILLVEDNEMNRDMLSRRLRRQGHSVEVAVNGRHALERLTDEADEAFDLVLLDIMMPEMNGFELLERLKAHETLRDLPVILISALDDADSVVRGIRMGADDHLPKPFNLQILRARVAACLAKKRLRDREQLHARSLELEFATAREVVDPGESLVLFTDGVTDARDADGVFFSEERLLSLLAAPGASAAETLDRLEAAVQVHSGNESPFDDVTLLAVHRDVTPAAEPRP